MSNMGPHIMKTRKTNTNRSALLETICCRRTQPLARGFATIELLIALAISVVVLTGATLVSFGGQSASLDAELVGGGLLKVGTKQAGSVIRAFSDFENINDDVASTSLGSVYEGRTTVHEISECMKGIFTGTGWASEKQRGQYIGLGTLVGNIAAVKALGGDCDSVGVSQNGWESPKTADIIDLIHGGSPATGVDVKRQGGKRLVFMTSIKVGNKDVFWVIDATDEFNPFLLGSYSEDGYDLNAVDAISDYAFVTGASPTAQLQVMNTVNPSAPTLAAKRVLPEAPMAVGRSIHFFDDKVYVGTQYLLCDI